MDLKNVVPSLNLYNWDWPIVTANYPDPPAKLVFDEDTRRGIALQSILSGGCIVAGGFVKDSVLGRNVFVDAGAASRDRSCSTTSTSAAARTGLPRHRRQERARRRGGPHRARSGARRPTLHGERRGDDRGPEGARHPPHQIAKFLTWRRHVARTRPSRSSSTGTSISRRARTRGRTNPARADRRRRSTTGTSASTPSATGPTPSRASTPRAGGSPSIVNNYARLSFNFGPTLARWIERHDPAVAGAAARRRRRAAAAPGRGRRDRAGLRAPDHSPVQCADRRTQLLWGLQDFRAAVRPRRPTACGCPRRRVSPRHADGRSSTRASRYTILAPEQIAACGPCGRRRMDDGQARQPRHRARLQVAPPRRLGSVAVHRRVRRADVARGGLRRGRQPRREPARGRRRRPRPSARGRPASALVLCASDGELLGSPQEVRRSERWPSRRCVEAVRAAASRSRTSAPIWPRHPPIWELRLSAGPRRRRDRLELCPRRRAAGGATAAVHDGGPSRAGTRRWRGPLRAALDILRRRRRGFYEDAGRRCCSIPGARATPTARCVDEPVAVRDALLEHVRRPRAGGGRRGGARRARLLLEMQRATLLMYASCGCSSTTSRAWRRRW